MSGRESALTERGGMMTETNASFEVDPLWYYGQINADEVEKLRRTDDPVWVVWKHLPPNNPDVCIIAAVTGDGPTSEEHARMFSEFLNERAGGQGMRRDDR